MLFARYNPEIIGYSIAEFGPLIWQGFVEESQNCGGKVIKFGIVFVMGDMFVHDAPKPFNRV